MASDEYSLSSDNGNEYDEEDSAEDDDSDDDEESESDSATEISTDSEFERNHSTVIKSEIPDIVISESLPTRRGHLEEIQTIQIVSKNVAEKSVPRLRDEATASVDKACDDDRESRAIRIPFVNPHRGDYYLNRTQSTEGVASKISLELKKKYLLGNDSTTNLVRKSESTSVLDTKFKSLVDQISEHQKLLNPAPEPSLTMQAFLDGAVKSRNASLSPTASVNLRKSKELSGIDDFQHVCSLSNNFDSMNAFEKRKSESSSKDSQAETDTSHTNSRTLVEERPPSPIYETSIVVPEFPAKETAAAADTSRPPEGTSTSEASSADECDDERRKSYHNATAQMSLPKVEVRDTQGELLPHDVEEAASRAKNVDRKVLVSAVTGQDEIKRRRDSKEGVPKIMAMPVSDQATTKDRDGAQILRHVSTPSELFVSADLNRAETKGSFSDKSSPSTPTSVQGDDNTLAVFTETELSDWARDEDCAVSESFDDLILGTPNITYRRHQKSKKRAKAKSLKGEDASRDEFVHVCGKTEKPKPPPFILANIDDMDIEFMDTGDDDGCADNVETLNPAFAKNSGYIEYVTSEDEAKTPLAEAVNAGFSSFPGCVVESDARVNGDVAAMENTGYQRNDVVSVHPDDYNNFVHRLQDRISPFGNVKDSIDVRKSKKSGKALPEGAVNGCGDGTNFDDPGDDTICDTGGSSPLKQVFQVFSDISERNNNYKDTFDFRKGEVRVVTFFVLKVPDYESAILIYL